jgi:hypothetical protein
VLFQLLTVCACIYVPAQIDAMSYARMQSRGKGAAQIRVSAFQGLTLMDGKWLANVELPGPLGTRVVGSSEHQLLAAWLRDEGVRRCDMRLKKNIPRALKLDDVSMAGLEIDRTAACVDLHFPLSKYAACRHGVVKLQLFAEQQVLKTLQCKPLLPLLTLLQTLLLPLLLLPADHGLPGHPARVCGHEADAGRAAGHAGQGALCSCQAHARCVCGQQAGQAQSCHQVEETRGGSCGCGCLSSTSSSSSRLCPSATLAVCLQLLSTCLTLQQQQQQQQHSLLLLKQQLLLVPCMARKFSNSSSSTTNWYTRHILQSEAWMHS